LHVIGRLADGATVEDAKAELAAIADRQREIHPQFLTGWSADAVPLRTDVVHEVKPALLVLMGAVALVLLIASVNVANLLLARSLSREREVAVRAAIGAGRSRLVRQFLAEGALIAVLGGGLGMLLAALALKALVLLDPGDIPLLTETRIDATVFAFAAGVTAITVLLFGLVPALRMSAEGPQASLRDARSGAGGARHSVLRSTLLVVEVALSVMLLVGAGLLVRSLVALQAVDPGFESDNVLTVSLNLPFASYGSHERVTGFYAQLVDRVRALPGVVAAAGTSEPPIIGFEMTRDTYAEGHVRAAGEREDYQYRAVEPGFFEAMRIRVVRGRAFEPSDRSGSRPVVIVNESMAKLFWPGGDPTTGRLRFSPEEPWIDVVGVVADTRHHGLDRGEDPVVYAPYGQKDWNWLSWQTLVVRTSGDPMAMARAVEREIRALDRQLPVQRFSTLDAIYAESMARRRLNTILLGAFAILALALGAIGVYGVIGYTVAQRTREIGIRMALGARRTEVIGSVVAAGARLALVGSALGLAGAWATTRLMRGMVFGVSAADPLTFAFVPILMLVVVLVAAWLPARRAASVEPLIVLRQG
jgi:predicted permease